MARVLVAYASKYGSTREIAEAVADTLRETGCEVDAVAAGSVTSLDGYSAAVVGGALYFFRWRKDARKFLARHRSALSGLPVAVFASGPIEDTPEQFDRARSDLDRALAKAAWLTPVSIAVFGGRLEPSGLRFPDANPAMKNMQASDIRDWPQIRAWAESLVAQLGLGGDSAQA
jgi:menaquinone-dependent protoporphyrinogen oxidase